MDVKEFVSKLFLLYPNSYTSENEFLKKRQYIVALESKKIDFQKLMDRIAKNHKSEFIPTTSWLLEEACFCYPQSSGSAWIQVRVYNPILKCEMSTDAFPKGTSEQAILNTYKKMFGGEGWRLIEVF